MAGKECPQCQGPEVFNIGTILILAMSMLASSPAPAPTSTPDPCGTSGMPLLATLNRPTIGYSACAVKRGRSLTEIGYANQFGTTPSTTFPQGFERFGIAPNVELDVIGPAFEDQTVNGRRQLGSFDDGLGAKFELWHDAAGAAAVDLLATVPTGTQGFGTGAPTQTINLDAGRSITSRFGVAGTLGIQSTAAPENDAGLRRFLTLLPSIAFTEQTGDRAQIYAEAYGTTRLHPDRNGGLFGIDYGVQYLLAPRWEIDVESGTTRTASTRERYVGFGFGIAL
jgi:hypothetical protein